MQFERSDRSIPRYVGNRTKQWLAYLRREYAGAQALFNAIKPLHDSTAIQQAIDVHIAQLRSQSCGKSCVLSSHDTVDTACQHGVSGSTLIDHSATAYPPASGLAAPMASQ